MLITRPVHTGYTAPKKLRYLGAVNRLLERKWKLPPHGSDDLLLSVTAHFRYFPVTHQCSTWRARMLKKAQDDSSVYQDQVIVEAVAVLVQHQRIWTLNTDCASLHPLQTWKVQISIATDFSGKSKYNNNFCRSPHANRECSSVSTGFHYQEVSPEWNLILCTLSAQKLLQYWVGHLIFDQYLLTHNIYSLLKTQATPYKIYFENKVLM